MIVILQRVALVSTTSVVCFFSFFTITVTLHSPLHSCFPPSSFDKSASCIFHQGGLAVEKHHCGQLRLSMSHKRPERGMGKGRCCSLKCAPQSNSGRDPHLSARVFQLWQVREGGSGGVSFLTCSLLGRGSARPHATPKSHYVVRSTTFTIDPL